MGQQTHLCGRLRVAISCRSTVSQTVRVDTRASAAICELLIPAVRQYPKRCRSTVTPLRPFTIPWGSVCLQADPLQSLPQNRKCYRARGLRTGFGLVSDCPTWWAPQAQFSNIPVSKAQARFAFPEWFRTGFGLSGLVSGRQGPIHSFKKTCSKKK